jgi:hypothetical protein
MTPETFFEVAAVEIVVTLIVGYVLGRIWEALKFNRKLRQNRNYHHKKDLRSILERLTDKQYGDFYEDLTELYKEYETTKQEVEELKETLANYPIVISKGSHLPNDITEIVEKFNGRFKIKTKDKPDQPASEEEERQKYKDLHENKDIEEPDIYNKQLDADSKIASEAIKKQNNDQQGIEENTEYLTTEPFKHFEKETVIKIWRKNNPCDFAHPDMHYERIHKPEVVPEYFEYISKKTKVQLDASRQIRKHFKDKIREQEIVRNTLEFRLRCDCREGKNCSKCKYCDKEKLEISGVTHCKLSKIYDNTTTEAKIKLLEGFEKEKPEILKIPGARLTKSDGSMNEGKTLQEKPEPEKEANRIAEIAKDKKRIIMIKIETGENGEYCPMYCPCLRIGEKGVCKNGGFVLKETEDKGHWIRTDKCKADELPLDENDIEHLLLLLAGAHKVTPMQSIENKILKLQQLKQIIEDC